MSLQDKLQFYQDCVETALNEWLPMESVEPVHLHQAMRYSVLGDGKRIRPILVYATGETLGVELNLLHAQACAVELIHAYSLIHDALPAMDNDDLRRGRPTCHKAFDEATAILAGDALQALAFYLLANDTHISVPAEQRLRMIEILAYASGSGGMAGGQAIDLASVGKDLKLAELENMHNHKTGALIRASVELGALSYQDLTATLLDKFSRYAHCIGLAFQIQDDILDIESDTDTLGKPQGSDLERDKPTYPNLLGMEGAKLAAKKLHEEALACISSLDNRADILRMIADYIIERKR